MTTLYIVATPIGNLEDITLRALRILKEVDLILCEDTRVTKRLLERYEIKTPTLSYHQHSKLQKTDYIIKQLQQGKNLALVSDAGTPCVSDPGAKLISLLVDKFISLNVTNQLKTNQLITVIPGPSAVTAAASVAGIPMDKFIFMGFPPHKKKRKKFFDKIATAEYPVIFYESPHRIIKSLRDLHRFTQMGKQIDADTKIVVCRELTKKFETIYRGDIEKVIKEIEAGEIKGEFVVIVG